MGKTKIKDTLRELCDRMGQIAGQLYALEMETKNIDKANQIDDLYRNLLDIETQTRIQVLSHLENIGTKRSPERIFASRANGKKGGRPPKRISELKKQIEGLLQKTQETENENEKAVAEQELETARKELYQLTSEWKQRKLDAKTT